MTNFLEMSAFHAFEKTYFISITAGILCPIFQISVLPALQILCQSSALKNLCQPWCIIPPTSSLPLLMWQNKPRPIRIKALKRSLKPLKVPLNWGMTIWAVWQQMLNGVIASPPQRGLLSHNGTDIQTLTHARVCVRHAHIHTHTLSLPSSQSTAVVFYSTCIVLTNADLVQHFSFFFLFSFPFSHCFAVNCQSRDWLWASAVSELLPRMKTNKHDNTLAPPTPSTPTPPLPFNDLFLFRTQPCRRHHPRRDAEMWGVNTEGCGLLQATHESHESRPTCVC